MRIHMQKKKKKGGGVYIRSALFKLQYIYNVDANPFSSVNNLWGCGNPQVESTEEVIVTTVCMLIYPDWVILTNKTSTSTIHCFLMIVKYLMTSAVLIWFLVDITLN